MLLGLTLYKFITVNLTNDKEFVQKRHPQLDKVLEEKPLYSIIFNLSKRGDYKIVHLLNCFYFLVINYQSKKTHFSNNITPPTSLIDCLHCFTISSFTSKKSVQKPNWVPSIKAFIAVVLLHQVLFFLTLLPVVIALVKAKLWFDMIVSYLLTFTINVTNNMSYILVYYYKYATIRLLDGLLHQLQKPDGNMSFSQSTEVILKQVEHELGRLAGLNHTLNQKLSLPLIISMLPLIFELLVFLSSLLFQQLSWGNVFLLQFPMHLVILCTIESVISNQLTVLSALLRVNIDKTMKLKSIFNFQLERKYLILEREEKRRKLLNAQKFQLLLVSVYRRYFELRIFNLFIINWSFAFELVLFMLEFVFLVTQTTSS